MSHLTRVPDGCSIGNLARAMEINQPGVCKIVNGLAQRGTVHVDTVAADARRRLVHLTPAGTDLLTQAQTAIHPEATLTFAGLDDDQLAALHTLLIAVRARLDDARRTDP